MNERGARSARSRLVHAVTVLAVAASGLTGVMTSAYFNGSAVSTANTFTSGAVNLTATPATSAITMAGMTPGDKVTAPITVTNTGSLNQRYSMSSVTTENLLAAQLELTIKTGVSTCTNAGFGSDGTSIYSAGDLGTVTGTKVIGDALQGAQAGDRNLAVSASEVLCAQVVLPTTTATTFQVRTTTATFTFNAEQVVAADAFPVLSGSRTGTTVAASWTAVPGATSYILTRVATDLSASKFNSFHGVAAAADGTVYVADSNNNRIRKVTAAAVVTTLAGQTTSGPTDGTGAAARFSSPYGVAVAADGIVYVADTGNHRIRKVTAAGVVTTLAGSTTGFADGTGAAAQFASPSSVAVDTAGNVYVADTINHRIRKVTAAGVVTTLAGSTNGFAEGTGAAAQFASPYGVAVDTDGTVFVADYGNHRIRKVTAAGVVTTLAGSTIGFAEGTGAAAKFNTPQGVAVAADGTVYVADYGNHRIRKVTAAGVVTTLAGSTPGFADATGAAARFTYPLGVAVAADGSVYVADYDNDRIRKVTAAGVVTTFAGSTPGFADTPAEVSSVVYTGTALGYTDTTLVVGTSYTYTVTAVGPGAVSNAIGPFMPLSVTDYWYSGSTDFVVPAGVTTIHIVAAGGSSDDYHADGGVLEGDLAVVPGDVLHLVLQTSDWADGGDARLTRDAPLLVAEGQGGFEDDVTHIAGGCSSQGGVTVTSCDVETNSGSAYLRLTYLP
jgi:streptogramin lyase